MKRRKRSVPVMLFWNRRDQARFIETVERLASLVNDLEKVLAPAKRKKLAADAKQAAARAAKAAASAAENFTGTDEGDTLQ